MCKWVGRKIWGKCPEGGYSIMEVMIAAAILGIIAIALLPAFLSLTDTSKVQGFRSTCAALARAKLQEYVNGVADNGSGGFVPSGFEYTKKRYSQSECQTTPALSPGFRERVKTNAIIADDAAGSSEVAAGLQANMLGFRLFVLIKHYNPRVLTGAASGSFTTGQPTRDCPSSNYQYFRLGDALEVTVTGMIRTDPAVDNGGRGQAKFGKLTDVYSAGVPSAPHPMLTCSVSQLIYPPRMPFRYYLGNDGKIRNYQATLAFNSGVPDASLQAMESHFRTLWAVGGNTAATLNSPAIANIRSFAVAPDNQSVYILKPGLLSLYRNCSDKDSISITDSSTGVTKTYNGIPDCDLEAPTSKNSWSIDPNIESIAVDFQKLSDATETTVSDSDADDDKVYGMFNSGSSGGDLRVLNKTTSTWETISGTGFSLPTNRPRIRSIFIAQSFPQLSGVTKPVLFFVDNSCYTGGTTTVSKWTYCASIFNSSDTNMESDVREMPSQVEGVSY